MSKLYSPSAGGFFCRTINGDAVPGDAVEISDEEWQGLLQAQSQGKVIKPDGASGHPVAVDRTEAQQ